VTTRALRASSGNTNARTKECLGLLIDPFGSITLVAASQEYKTHGSVDCSVELRRARHIADEAVNPRFRVGDKSIHMDV
jgi:hypothetical protein